MAYKRRYAKRTRKTYRKRSYKKAMFKRKRSGFQKSLTKYDGNHKECIITSGNLIQGLGNGSMFPLQISWETNNSLSGDRYSAYRSSTQWTQCTSMYKEYRIKGFQLELFPQTQVIGSGNSSIITSIEIFSNPEDQQGVAPTNFPSPDQAMRYLDYKTFSPHQNKITRNYRTLGARMSRYSGVYPVGGWRACSDPANNEGLTFCKFNTLNYNVNDVFGRWVVKWFIQFRNRTV